MATTHAELVAQEELDALEAEHMAPATIEQIGRAKEYLRINKEIAKLNTEKAKIANSLKSEMTEEHITALTHDGLVIVARVSTKSTKVDSKGLAKDHPEIAEAYITTTETERFEIKK